MDGCLLIDKPEGISSFDVLRKLRKTFQERKMGHLGTLDPMATGLLVVFLGKGTQLIKYFPDLAKRYEVELELGKSSDTYDRTGEVHSTGSSPWPSSEQLHKSLQTFLGMQWQVQPAYSALKIDGKRAYEWAREGKAKELGKRQVSFFELEIRALDLPGISLHVHCSHGTYVRSLVHEWGQQLATGALMTALRRTEVGPFKLQDAQELESVQAAHLLSLEQAIELIDWKGRAASDRQHLCKRLGIHPEKQT